MARMLDVCLDEHLVGHLIQDDGGQMSFAYLESWLAQPGAAAFSQSLPLRKKRFPAKECRGFFGGILPEGNKREIIARNLGISARNDYAMLEQIGGECAGAVTFIPARQELPKRDYHYRKKVETRKVEDVEHLQVERYDRKHVTIDGAPGVERLHQEDFCQTQNIVSELKYQKEGGPSFKQCFILLRNVSTAPVIDLANLLDAAIFNYPLATTTRTERIFRAPGQGNQAGNALRCDQHDLLSRTEHRHGYADRARILIG